MSKLAVVTGGNSGLGAPLSVMLAGRGYDIIFLNRSEARSRDVLTEVRRARTGINASVIETDLSDHGSIRRAMAQVASRTTTLDLLVNNAGVLLGEKTMSPQGAEMHFQVNTVSPYLLMKLALPLLAKARNARVLNVGSAAMYMPPVGPLKVSALNDPPRVGHLVGAYAQSKMALAAVSAFVAPEFMRQNIIIRVAEPGPNKTTMTAGDGMPKILLFLRPLIFKEPAVGARKLFDAAFSPKLGERTGVFVENGKVRALPPSAGDTATQRALMTLVETIAAK